MKHHTFVALQDTPYCLEGPDIADEHQQWWLVGAASTDNLWELTNLDALAAELFKRYDKSSIRCGMDDDGFLVVIVNPDDDACVASASALWDIAQQGHINESLYNTAINEAIDERWDDMDLSERIDLFGEDTDLSSVWDRRCPDDLRSTLEEWINN